MLALLAKQNNFVLYRIPVRARSVVGDRLIDQLARFMRILLLLSKNTPQPPVIRLPLQKQTRVHDAYRCLVGNACFTLSRKVNLCRWQSGKEFRHELGKLMQSRGWTSSIKR